MKLIDKEILCIQMALSLMQEHISESMKSDMPFTPAARKDMREMLFYASTAHAKITKCIGKEIVLGPYIEGDEKEFFTKES